MSKKDSYDERRDEHIVEALQHGALNDERECMLIYKNIYILGYMYNNYRQRSFKTIAESI